MYQTTSDYKKAIKQNIRDVKIIGTVKLTNGSTVNLYDEDIVQGSLYINNRCTSSDDIDIGTVYAGEMGLSVYYDGIDNAYRYDGASISFQFGLKINDNGDYEWIPLGRFNVNEIKRNTYSVNLICVDDIIRLDKSATSELKGSLSGVKKTMYQWIQTACLKCGVSLGTLVEEIADYPNSDLELEFVIDKDDTTDYTWRDVVQFALTVIGAFGFMNKLGKFQIKRIHSDIDYTSYPDDRFSSDLSDYDVQITKFSYKDSNDKTYSSGKDGYELAIEKNPFFANANKQLILDNLLSYFGNIKYSICNFSENGDPSLDIGDTVLFYAVPKTDEYLCVNTHAMLSEKTHEEISKMKYGSENEEDLYKVAQKVVAMNITWKYRQDMTVNSYGKESLSRREYNPVKNLTQSIVKLTKDIVNVNLQNQYLNECIGGYVLLRTNDETKNEILIMDNPDPEKAVKIWRWNLNGLGYSNNCTGADNPDRTYDIAITMDGQISGKFVRTGKILSADGTLSIDLDNNKAEINGKVTADSGRIGGWEINNYQIFGSSTYGYTVLQNKSGNTIVLAVSSKRLNDTDTAKALSDGKLKIFQNGDIWSDSTSARTIIADGKVEIYGAGTVDANLSSRNLKMRLDSNGINLYSGSEYYGSIGLGQWSNEPSKKGLNFHLENSTDYMSWAWKKTEDATVYTTQLLWKNGEGFYFGCNVDFGWYEVTKIKFADEQAFDNGIKIYKSLFIPNDVDCNIYSNIDMHNWQILNSSFGTSSDERLKENISNSKVNALEMLNRLNPVEFDWKKDKSYEELGFIAQQVKSVNKKFVGKDNEGYLNIKYTDIIPYLIKAIQELTEEIEELKKNGNNNI